MTLVSITLHIHKENLEALTVPFSRPPTAVEYVSLSKLEDGTYRLAVPRELCVVVDPEDQG